MLISIILLALTIHAETLIFAKIIKFTGYFKVSLIFTERKQIIKPFIKRDFTLEFIDVSAM